MVAAACFAGHLCQSQHASVSRVWQTVAVPSGPGPTASQTTAATQLTATAALVWNGYLPRPLQQILFDTADGVTPAQASSPPAAAQPEQHHEAELASGGTPACAGGWN